MRISTILIVPVAAAALTFAGVSAASAGEITGNGKPTHGPAHAKSICVFSGLEDGGDFPGQPAGPGAPPQNWGHIPKELKPILTAEGSNPGAACNGHTGIFAGGGEE